VTGVGTDDFLLVTNGVVGAAVTTVAGSGTTYTVTVDSGSGDGTLRLDVGDDDTILRAGTSPTDAAEVTFTVTFSESVTGVDIPDFALTATALPGAALTGVSGSGDTWTVTASTGLGDGTIRLDVADNDSILDAVTNPLGGTGAGNGDYAGGETYIIDRTGEIHGRKWDDRDGDGYWDPAEPGMAGVTMFLDLNNNSTLDAGEPTAITEADDPGTTGVDETGQYRFEDLGPATYFITEVTRTGWEQTYPFSRTGATGQLTFVEAVKDGVGGVDGLYFASGVSISADGKHLYVAGKRDDAIAVFSRNATTGALTYVQKCTHTSLVLTDVIAVTVSPDGGHVYTANDIRDMVGVFSRSTSTGQLTFVEEFTDNSNGIDGLDEAWYGTVSPDGTKLYVVGATDDTLVTFSRNAGTVQPLRYTVTLSSGEAAGPLDFANANDAPRVTTITRLDSTPTGASSVRFAVTFSEVVTGVDSGDFLFGPGAASGATITNISGSGTDYTVTVDTGSGDGTLRLDLTDDDSILDGGDRPLGGVGTGDGDFTGGESYVIDRTPPDVAFIGRSGANPTDKSEVGFTVTFTESVTGVDVGDFNLVATGSIAGEAIVSVSGSGSTYTVTASAGSGDGTLRLDLVDDDSIIDQMSSVSGLTGAFSVTVSPDGKNVYVASTSGTSSSSTDGAIVAFSRNPATGQVTKLNAIYETSTDYGLGGAQSVTVSPDGKHIYVAGTFDDAVAVLSRDETTGALTHVQTMRAGTDLDYVQSLAVSPDGSYVYAVGTDYVTTLARNETTGQLSHVQTLRDGVDGIDGLDNADSIVMSPDGKHVYTVSYFDDALVAFDRNATTGELSLIEIEWNGQNGVDGLYLAYSVTISSDGKHVYTVSRSGGLAVFARDPATGEVTFIDVIQEGVDVTNVLAGAHDVKVANDGAHVYVASYLDNTLSTFSRDPSTGLLSFVQVHTDGVAGIDGLYGVRGVAVSPDGSHVYTASYDDDLVVFERDGRVRRQHRIDVATAQVVENIDFGNHDLPPVVESLVRADTDPTNQTEVDYTLTFNEPVTGVDPTDFALATSGVSSASVTGVSGGSVVYTVTVNTGNGDGTLRLDLTDDDSIVDSVGNELGGAGSGNGNFTGEIYTIDKTGPRVSSIVRVDPNPTSAASVRFTVNFNEGVTGVDVGDFTLSTTGVLTGASITDLSGSGSTRTVTINTGDGNGTLRLDLSDNDTIIDGLGNPLGGAGTGNGDYTSGQDYTVLKTGEVHGTKWRDLDGDGVRDAGEPGLVDVRIFADLNNNGVLDGNEPNTLTLDDDPATTTVDETGTYQLTAVPAGTRAIVELVPAGYEQSFPATTVSGTGQLTFVEAVKDAQDDVAGLYGAQALAASPDGRHIYAGSYLDDSLAVFGRDPATGKLAFVQAVEDNVAGVDGLHEVLDVVVSPDGAHVYAVGGADDAVAVFSRDATSGQLSFVQAVYDDQNGVDGLDLPKSVAISPDGDHLYVASTYDNALAVFSRNAATGELTFVRVLKDGQGGVDALAGANSVAVSPDGNYVFATASTDRSVMQFARNATTGELTLSTTRTDGVGDADGLNASRAVTVSPDSEHVYVAASFPDHSVATYAEAQPAAGLPFVQVLKDGAGGVDGLAGARSVSVSPDGRNVYVAGSDDDALAVFGRDAATGQLSYSQTLWDDQGGVDGLDYSPSVIVSPDGLHVYAASYYDHAVSVFQRSVDSQQSIPHNVPVTAGQVTADVHFGNRPVWPTVVSVVRADANPTAAATVDFTVTFSENVSAVDAGDFSVLAVGVTGAVVTGVTGSDNTYTVTVNTGSGEGTIRLAVNDDDSINDTDANPLGGNGADNGEYLSGESYAVDKVPPAVVSIVRLDPNPTSATRVSYEVTFSEDVTGVDVGDFTVYADGLTGTNVDRMSGSGAVYTVYVNTGTGEGTVRLDVDDNDSIVNDFGNPLGGLGANNGIFNSGESYTIATTGSLEGIKWNDGNGNGVRDAGEPGLANWKIYLDANRNGQLDAGETSTLTATDDAGTPGVDETGWYTFTGLVPGTHAMAEEVQTGWQQTWPGPAGVDLERIVADDSRQSYTPAISGDGRFVAFASTRSDLVANDTNNRRDIFVYDRQTDTIERVSVHSNGTQSTADSWEPTISEDGRYVAFRSGASNLVDVDTNGDYDIFVHDRDTDETVLASVDSDAVQGDSYSYKPNLSDDGRYVAFWSNANNLVPNDTNQVRDIFVRDLVNGTTERVSVDSDENQAMGGHSYGPVLSADGRYVVFQSAAANLVAGDTNQKADVFVRDRVAGTTERVSVASDASEGNGASSKRWINDDGRYVVFESTASNLVPGDTNGRADIFLHDRDAGQTRRVSVGSDGTQGDNNSYLPQISGDGRYVAFQSWATNFDSRDSNATRDVFVHDVLTGSTRRLSVATDGSDSNGLSETAAISSDGRFVAFPSEATNLLSQDPLQKGGLFVADVQVPTTPGSWNANVSLGVTTEDIDFGNQGISAAPTSVDLLAASDTGASNTDNLTNLDNSTAGTRLQFEVSGTVSGATVGVYADGTLIGSAVASGVTTTVTTNGSNDLVDGSHSITARQTIEGKMLSPASSALSFIVDTAAATITDVIIGSSFWTNAGFIDAVDGGGTGAGNGLGLSLPGSGQLRNLPWINIDKIYIQFSEDVAAAFSAANLALVGT
ncbi:MAG: beta-propeller fold lactonase family protein, partial [Pirellulales bacterium]